MMKFEYVIFYQHLLYIPLAVSCNSLLETCFILAHVHYCRYRITYLITILHLPINSITKKSQVPPKLSEIQVSSFNGLPKNWLMPCQKLKTNLKKTQWRILEIAEGCGSDLDPKQSSFLVIFLISGCSLCFSLCVYFHYFLLFCLLKRQLSVYGLVSRADE